MTENKDILTWREAVRKRPAMYVGGTGSGGFIRLLRSLIRNVYVRSQCDRVEIEISDSLSGKLTFKNLRCKINDLINEVLNLGEYEFPVFNATCKRYQFRLFDDRRNIVTHQIYQEGMLQHGKVKNQEFFACGLEIDFTLDDSIWNLKKINVHQLTDAIRELAYLSSDKKFEINYTENGERSRIFYQFEQGLLDRLEFEKNWADAKFIGFARKDFGDFSMEAAFGLTPYSYTDKFVGSYVNFARTADHGTHLVGLLKGLKKGLKEYRKKHCPDTKLLVNSSSIKNHLFAAIHVRLDKPTYWGPTRGKLQTHEIIKPIAKYVAAILMNELEKDQKSADEFIRRFEYV